MQDALTRATYKIANTDLQRMTLSSEHLPQEFTAFELIREQELTNEAMANLPLSDHTAEELRNLGRLAGYQREWVTTIEDSLMNDNMDLVVATVVHLLASPEAVSEWMTKVFLGEFMAKVDDNLESEHRLISVEEIQLEGQFYDQAVGVRAVQHGPKGLVSSSILDFRLGRLLGVAYVVTSGDQDRLGITEVLGKKLERQMVAVTVGLA